MRVTNPKPSIVDSDSFFKANNAWILFRSVMEKAAQGLPEKRETKK